MELVDGDVMWEFDVDDGRRDLGSGLDVVDVILDFDLVDVIMAGADDG